MTWFWLVQVCIINTYWYNKVPPTTADDDQLSGKRKVVCHDHSGVSRAVPYWYAFPYRQRSRKVCPILPVKTKQTCVLLDARRCTHGKGHQPNIFILSDLPLLEGLVLVLLWSAPVFLPALRVDRISVKLKHGHTNNDKSGFPLTHPSKRRKTKQQTLQQCCPH